MLFEEKIKNLNPGELKTLKELIKDFGLGVFVHTHFITIENSNIVELQIDNRKHMGSYSVKRKKIIDISTSFFELISEFKHLRRLTICGCDLNSIPQNISKLSRLFSLDISDNNFTDLSLVFRSLALLPNLEQLLLRSNNICSIPENISNLQSLKILYLENNNIKELPSTFGDLIKLENLELHNNGLTHIPEAVFSLKNLSHLGVMGNKLTDVSKNIRNLKKLLILDIDENVILNDEVMYFLLLKFAKKGFAHIYPGDEPWDHLVFTPFKSHHKNPERFKEFISNFMPHVKGLDPATQKVGIIFLSAIILSSSVTRDLFWNEVYDKSPFSSLWEEIFFSRAQFYLEIEAIYDDRQVLPPIDAKYFSSKLKSIKEKEFHKTLETLKEIEKSGVIGIIFIILKYMKKW